MVVRGELRRQDRTVVLIGAGADKSVYLQFTGETPPDGRIEVRGQMLDLGRLANENLPRLRTMDGKGNRLDLVEFHPAYHALMQMSIGHGIHASAHDGSDRPAPMSLSSSSAHCCGMLRLR